MYTIMEAILDHLQAKRHVCQLQDYTGPPAQSNGFEYQHGELLGKTRGHRAMQFWKALGPVE